MSTFAFSVSTTETPVFGPRIGQVTLRRDEHESTIPISIPTPGIITATSRGVVPHLSWDNVARTQAIRWVNVPFHTFLERKPPLPTLVQSEHPLHELLGFTPEKHLLSVSVRDPAESRELPPNGNAYVTVQCVRGVRQCTLDEWRTYATTISPDLIVALSDTPFTPPPYSQKRLTKSVERSHAWLVHLLTPASDRPRPANVLVHMVGGAVEQARTAFADGLLEEQWGKEGAAIAPLRTLDEGVAGYVFDLVPLRTAVHAALGESEERSDASPAPHSPPPPKKQPLHVAATKIAQALVAEPEPMVSTTHLVPLLEASLASLPAHKPRIVNSARSPQEMLRLVRDVGVDLFDAHFAQRAADVGVSLDFVFPAPRQNVGTLGHNLYDGKYAHDFNPLADAFSGAAQKGGDDKPVCPCFSCSPMQPTGSVSHSALDPVLPPATGPDPPTTRAYVHHLLHTHEMSAHTLLVAHNLAVLDVFLAGVRRSLGEQGVGTFATEVDRFIEVYGDDDPNLLFDEATKMWREVELARGKGRLKREAAKQAESSLGTAVEL